MPELQRMTTQYVDIEDRFRIAGEISQASGDRQTSVMWLTQRLLLRILPHMLAWLENQTISSMGSSPLVTESLADAIQEFAMQSARAEMPHQEPVAAVGRAWLVHTITLDAAPAFVRLSFFPQGAGGSDGVSVAFDLQLARQWLGILHDQWVGAQWPASVWPAWFASKSNIVAITGTSSLH